jgi:uncharacterized protein (DUF983 family)
MGIFNNSFGKKKKKSNAPVPPPLPADKNVPLPVSKPVNDPLALFAMKASQTEATIEMPLLQVSQLITHLQASIQKEYPNIDQMEAFSHANGGLSIRCPRCGQLSDQIIPLLGLAGSGVFKNAVFGGPNVASVSQGKCPGCGGTRAFVTFNPAKVKAREAALKSSAADTAGVPKFLPTLTFPYLASISISPNEEMAAWVRGGKPGEYEIVIASTESGTEVTHFIHPGVESAPTCQFVGNDRLWVKTKLAKEIKNINLALFDASNGKKMCEIDIPECSFSNPCVNHETKTIAAEKDIFALIILETAGDTLAYRTIKTGQIFGSGPRIGSDGKVYLNVAFSLFRLEGDTMVQVMEGDHCICCDPTGKVYSGGGYGDRSGESKFRVADLKSGTTSNISWGKDPVDQIELAGEGELLIASIVYQVHAARYPNALLSLFSLSEKKKKWMKEINDLKAYVKPILFSAPKEGWALIQTGRTLEQVSFKDGKTMKIITKELPEIVTGTWVPAKKMIAITRIPGANALGILEWYKL